MCVRAWGGEEDRASARVQPPLRRGVPCRVVQFELVASRGLHHVWITDGKAHPMAVLSITDMLVAMRAAAAGELV